ncbi:hypothetical protein OAG71_01155 [bacterium]|nr:hypothetical protein [bacterium]
MSLKYAVLGFVVACLVVAGCRTGNSVWSKPGYQAVPAVGGASRTYSPTQSVSPYQQSSPNYGGSGTTAQGYSQPSYSAPNYGGSGSAGSSYGGSGGR